MFRALVQGQSCSCVGARAVVHKLLSDTLQPLAAAAEQAATSFDPDSPTDAASMLAALALPVARLQSLLTGIAMTHAQTLMHRAPGVRAFASQLKVLTIYSNLTCRACVMPASAAMLRYDLLDTCIHVQHATQTMTLQLHLYCPTCLDTWWSQLTWLIALSDMKGITIC